MGNVMINKELIQDKSFLDREGQEWVVEDAAGTGLYSWYCRNIDTDQRERFDTEYIFQRVASYNTDVEHFKNKNIKEAEMINLIKKVAEQLVRNEILKDVDWSNKELDLLNELKNGKFDIKCE